MLCGAITCISMFAAFLSIRPNDHLANFGIVIRGVNLPRHTEIRTTHRKLPVPQAMCNDETPFSGNAPCVRTHKEIKGGIFELSFSAAG